MSIVLRAAVRLEPGCRLYYDCPLGGDDFRSQQFFEKYHGKYATFVGYSEKHIGVLDSQGRMPGRYINPDGIRVRFEGEEEEHGLNIRHFILADGEKATLAEGYSEDQRVGDLPHPILYYPGDMVRFKLYKEGRENAPRLVRQVFVSDGLFATDGIPRYEVMETEHEARERNRKFDEENAKRPDGRKLVKSLLNDRHGWNTSHEEIELVSRGNVWALYNDPSKLTFASDEEESEFWAKDGIGKRASSKKAEARSRYALASEIADDHSLEAVYKLFTSGEADVINRSEIARIREIPDRYVARKLHECFAEHRERVHALTQRLWAHQVKQTAA